MCSLGYSRNNNSALSVPNKRTYWALTKSDRTPKCDELNVLEFNNTQKK